MSTTQSKCTLLRSSLILSGTEVTRFIDCEKWRKEFGVDELVRNFNYEEKPKVFEYYPQYYHKTDKVVPTTLRYYVEPILIPPGWTTSLHRATWEG